MLMGHLFLTIYLLSMFRQEWIIGVVVGQATVLGLWCGLSDVHPVKRLLNTLLLFAWIYFAVAIGIAWGSPRFGFDYPGGFVGLMVVVVIQVSAVSVVRALWRGKLPFPVLTSRSQPATEKLTLRDAFVSITRIAGTLAVARWILLEGSYGWPEGREWFVEVLPAIIYGVTGVIPFGCLAVVVVFGTMRSRSIALVLMPVLFGVYIYATGSLVGEPMFDRHEMFFIDHAFAETVLLSLFVMWLSGFRLVWQRETSPNGVTNTSGAGGN